jgi:hypothetical protein
MKKRIAGYLLALVALVGVVASGTSAAQLADQGTTNYGSGVYPGPTTSVIQDPGWASSSLQWGMVGDSITYRCAPELRAAFSAKGINLAIRANSGADMDAINTWLESLTYMPDRIIVAGGTNNVFDPFSMKAEIARTKAAIGLGTELVWVDTYVGRSATLADDIRNSGQVNDAIHAAVPADHVVDWLANLTSTRGRGLAISYYLQDGVHPWVSAGTGHGDGCANYAAVVMNTVTPLL